MPQAHVSGAQESVGHLQNDAAHALIGKKIVTGELQTVRRPHHVKEKWVAAPTHEQAVVSGRGHMCLACGQDRCSFYDWLPAVACAGGLPAFNAARCCSLGSALA